MVKAIYRQNIRRTAKARNKKLIGNMSGFASDCVETLEEISIQGKETFLKMEEKTLI